MTSCAAVQTYPGQLVAAGGVLAHSHATHAGLAQHAARQSWGEQLGAVLLGSCTVPTTQSRLQPRALVYDVLAQPLPGVWPWPVAALELHDRPVSHRQV